MRFTASVSSDTPDICQAQSLRQQISGVSLDTEAVNLMQYERSYDAISKMLGVLNTLSLDVVNLLPPVSNS
jgi:flagellar hook-associated protein 1 FlgK